MGDFNINCLNYEENNSVRNFLNNLFQKGTIPLINKPTKVTVKSATLIDNIFTNCIFNNSLKIGIIKNSTSDHFPIFFAINTSRNRSYPKRINYKKRIYSDTSKAAFKEHLSLMNWRNITDLNNANEMYEKFVKTFIEIYENYFPLKEVSIKTKDLQTPWMSRGLKKSSKQKQKLYIKEKNDEPCVLIRVIKTYLKNLKKKPKINSILHC